MGFVRLGLCNHPHRRQLSCTREIKSVWREAESMILTGSGCLEWGLGDLGLRIGSADEGASPSVWDG